MYGEQCIVIIQHYAINVKKNSAFDCNRQLAKTCLFIKTILTRIYAFLFFLNVMKKTLIFKIFLSVTEI